MNSITLPLKTIDRGREWFLYAVDFKTPDGHFSTYIYALSDEHAQMLCQEMRETLTVSGQVCGVQKA